MKPTEIEFKYNAADISLEDFTRFCINYGKHKFILPSGLDHFYAAAKIPDSFYRHRVGQDTNQLTFKRKLSDNNNYVRTEHNIDLAPEMCKSKVEALVAEHGYTYKSSLFKNAFVYEYDKHTFVWYIVYDAKMKELGRFIEIEMSEDHPWTNEDEAWDELKRLEQSCKILGITAQSRIKLSLFEQYVK